MVKVTNIKDLRPELLEKSDAELDRLETEIKMARQYRAEEGARKEREAKIAQASEHIDKVLEGLRFLHDNGFLTDRVVATFTNAKGIFTPHLSFRKPLA